MKPTEILSSEHRVIERVLAALEAFAEESERTQVLDRDLAAKAVLFLKTFADKCHHGKEEGHLFRKLVDKGLPQKMGPVGVMLFEHEVGRGLIRKMDEAQSRLQAGSTEPLSEFVAAAREYISLLRAHILKEDNILFPMADGMLSEAEQSSMVEAFRKTEHEDMPAGAHDDMLKIADLFTEKFKVPGNLPVAAGHSCGCNCH